MGRPSSVSWLLQPRIYKKYISVHLLLPVGGENYSSSLFGDAQDAVPQKPFGFWVHASGGLILTRIKEASRKQRCTSEYTLLNKLYARIKTDITEVAPKIVTNHII